MKINWNRGLTKEKANEGGKLFLQQINEIQTSMVHACYLSNWQKAPNQPKLHSKTVSRIVVMINGCLQSILLGARWDSKIKQKKQCHRKYLTLTYLKKGLAIYSSACYVKPRWPWTCSDPPVIRITDMHHHTQQCCYISNHYFRVMEFP